MSQKTAHDTATRLTKLSERQYVKMTSVRTQARFRIFRKSTKRRFCLRTSQKVFPDSANGVVISEQSNKDSMKDGFCGEPFADKGELLSSLSPVLFSMKLLGLYFNRKRRNTDDPEWNNSPTKTPHYSTWLRIYATVVLILVWLNAFRLVSLFSKNDHFSDLLLINVYKRPSVRISSSLMVTFSSSSDKDDGFFRLLSNCNNVHGPLLCKSYRKTGQSSSNASRDCRLRPKYSPKCYLFNLPHVDKFGRESGSSVLHLLHR